MAVGLKTNVPWIMCKSKDAPGEVVNAKIKIIFFKEKINLGIKNHTTSTRKI